MAFGKALKGLKRKRHFQEVGVRIVFLPVSRKHLYHKAAHAAPVKVGYVLMTIVAFGTYCKEQCLLRKTKAAAVGKNPSYVAVALAITARAYKSCNFFNCVNHLN